MVFSGLLGRDCNSLVLPIIVSSAAPAHMGVTKNLQLLLQFFAIRVAASLVKLPICVSHGKTGCASMVMMQAETPNPNRICQRAAQAAPPTPHPNDP